MAGDTETTGLNPHDPEFQVLIVQISTSPGQSLVCRVSPDYFPDHPLFAEQGPEQLARLRSQIKQLCENPRIKKIGHNLKFDHHALRTMGIETSNWFADTELLARFVAENFFEYGLDEMVRIYVPTMAGYVRVPTKKDLPRTVLGDGFGDAVQVSICRLCANNRV